jgi:multiple sugar transport system permease protein
MSSPAVPNLAATGLPKSRSPLTLVSRDGLSKLAFLLPLLIVFGVFSWFPIVRAIIMSFQETDFVHPTVWVGLDNFYKVLGDHVLPQAIMNTLYFALLAFIFGYPVPLVLAIIMSEARHFKGLYSTLAYIPVVIPPVVSALLWRFMYTPDSRGFFNSLLAVVGIAPAAWLNSQTLVMPSIVIEATWAAAGGTVIIYLAALLTVPSELYDAAEVDGASIPRKIWHVTLPHMRSIMLITLILQFIATFQLFNEPYLMTGGGPANASATVLVLVYRWAFEQNLGVDYGAATALSLLLAIAIGLFTAVYFWVTKSWSTTS